MKIRSVIIIFLSLVFLLDSVSYPQVRKLSPKEKRFFKKFTAKKRNINTIKLKYLKLFFPMIGLTRQDAINIYNFRKKKQITSEDILRQVPGMTDEKIKILKKYFIFKRVVRRRREDIYEEIEDLIGEEETSEEPEVLEVLEKYKDNPLDLNSATRTQLEEFPWISPLLALKIIRYREKQGGFKSVKELRKVKGMTPEIYSKIRPFVTVEKVKVKPVKKKFLEQLSGKIRIRIMDTYPYPNEYLIEKPKNRWIHNPLSIKTRLDLKYGKHYKGGISTERDIGEISLTDSLKYYLMAEELWKIKKVILGNYRLYFGQGLVFYAGDMKKGGEVIKIKQKSKGIKEDLTSDENMYYYGGALQFGISFFDIYGFFSSRWHEATLEDQGTRYKGSDYEDDTPDDSSDDIITSFDPGAAGYHRSETQRAKVDKLKRTIFGGRLEATPDPAIKLGATFYHCNMNPPLNPDVRNNYYYKLRGDWVEVGGLDFDFVYNTMNLFGEFALSMYPKIDNPVTYNPYTDDTGKRDYGPAFLIGNFIDVGKFEVAFMYRNYSKKFYNYDAGVLVESDHQNEKGFYFGVRAKPDNYTKVWLYTDIYYRDWRKYEEPTPTSGYEVYWRIERKIFRKFLYLFKAKLENKDYALSTEEGQRAFWHEYDWRFRNQLTWEPTSRVRYKLSYEFARTHIPYFDKLYNGHTTYFDIKYQYTSRLTFYFRTMLWDTPYESQISTFENTIPMYMENLSFTGQGIRTYLLIKDKINDNMQWALKISRSVFYKAVGITTITEEESEEEAETYTGNSKYAFRLYMEYKF